MAKRLTCILVSSCAFFLRFSWLVLNVRLVFGLLPKFRDDAMANTSLSLTEACFLFSLTHWVTGSYRVFQFAFVTK